MWGKIVSTIDTKSYTSQKEIYYDDDGKKVRSFLYKDVKKYGKYYLPTLWIIQPFDTPTHKTILKIEEAKYDAKINPAYFSKSALKRYSN